MAFRRLKYPGNMDILLDFFTNAKILPRYIHSKGLAVTGPVKKEG